MILHRFIFFLPSAPSDPTRFTRARAAGGQTSKITRYAKGEL